MAIPEDRCTIRTNLSRVDLNRILWALENKEAVVVPGSDSLFAEAGSWQVDFQGSRYAITEFTEIIDSVLLI